jgi:hypothetical protein
MWWAGCSLKNLRIEKVTSKGAGDREGDAKPLRPESCSVLCSTMGYGKSEGKGEEGKDGEGQQNQ